MQILKSVIDPKSTTSAQSSKLNEDSISGKHTLEQIEWPVVHHCLHCAKREVTVAFSPSTINAG